MSDWKSRSILVSPEENSEPSLMDTPDQKSASSDWKSRSVPVSEETPASPDQESLLSRILTNAIPVAAPLRFFVGQQGLEDTARGAAQGATLGHSDEIAGAVEAAKGKLMGDKEDEGQNLGQLYRKYQQLEQAKNAAAHERSPWLYKGGELAGGMASAVLTSPLLAELGIGGELAANASLGAKAGAAAKQGAVLGGLIGEGTSQNTIEGNSRGLVGDTLWGSALGAATSAALPYAGQKLSDAGKYLGEKFENTNLGPLVKRAYEEGKKGLGFTGRADTQMRLQQETDAARDITKSFIGDQEAPGAMGQLGKNISGVLDEAASNGVQIGGSNNIIRNSQGLLEQLESNRGILGTQTTDQIMPILHKLANGESVGPQEANLLRQVVRDARSKVSNDAVRNNMSDMFSSIYDEMKQKIPAFGQANSLYNKVGNIIETIPGKGLTPAETGINLSHMRNEDKTLITTLRDIFRKSELPGSQAEDSINGIMALKDSITKFEQENPGVLKNLGLDPEKLLGKITDQSQLSSIRRLISGRDPREGAIDKAFDLTKGGVLRGANAFGKALAENPAQKSRSIYSASKEALMDIGNTLLQNPKTAPLAQALHKAILENNNGAKNAVLFSLLQNPETREVIQNNNQ